MYSPDGSTYDKVSQSSCLIHFCCLSERLSPCTLLRFGYGQCILPVLKSMGFSTDYYWHFFCSEKAYFIVKFHKIYQYYLKPLISSSKICQRAKRHQCLAYRLSVMVPTCKHTGFLCWITLYIVIITPLWPQIFHLMILNQYITILNYQLLKVLRVTLKQSSYDKTEDKK